MKKLVQAVKDKIPTNKNQEKNSEQIIPLKPVGVLGHGSYGTVYDAVSPRGSHYAIKRNFSSENIRGIGAVRESDLMIKLSHHQHIVNLKDFKKDALPQNPLSPPPTGMSADPLYFVMHKADTDLENLIHDSIVNNYSYRDMKYIMFQTLTALDFLHDSGVLHRDIKPGNILVNHVERDGKKYPHARLCDFGLSTQHTTQGYLTPNTYTMTYRAPEVCIVQLRDEAGLDYDNYSYPADVWALGCVWYHMIAGAPFMQPLEENEHQLIAILQYGPDEVYPETVKAALGPVVCRNLSDCTWDQRPYRRENRLSFGARAVPLLIARRFEQETSNGSSSIYQYVDLLSKILRWNPCDRLTVKQCLNHPWFAEYQELLGHYRKFYQPVAWNDRVQIPRCIEREWSGKIARDLYDQGNCSREIENWYSNRILFHALDGFDRWLSYKLSTASPDALESLDRGKVYSRLEAESVFWTLVYLYTKYFHSSILFSPYEEIVPATYRENPRLQELMDQTELQILSRGNLYHLTLFEAADLAGVRLNRQQIGDLVLMYMMGSIPRDGRIQDIFAGYMKIVQGCSVISDLDRREREIRKAILR